MLIVAKSYFSLKYGVLSVETLVELAVKHGVKHLLLADINNSTACTTFIKKATAAGVKPLVGITFSTNGHIHFIAVAANMGGFEKINRFYSSFSLNRKPLPEQMPFMYDVFVLYPLARARQVHLHDHAFILVEPTQVNKLWHPDYKNSGKKMLAAFQVMFNNRQDIELHKHLVAIDKNTLLSKLNHKLDVAPDNAFFTNIHAAQQAFVGYETLLYNANDFINQCHVAFDFNTPKNKKCFTQNTTNDIALLHQLAYNGMYYRYGNNPSQNVVMRLQKELDIIEKLNFCAYFLITWDIVQYSLGKGYYHVGRGSGANSLVAFCLKITDVDPIELDLYFERFLNPKRSSPPDFDLDFSWKNRDDVLQFIFNKYGFEHTALLGTITTFQGRSIIRELGKVYGLPKSEIDDLVENRKRGNMGSDQIKRNIEALWPLMNNMPHQRSIHAGGVLISELSIYNYSALDLPPKGLPTVQWDMYTAETIGFEKFDILSQRGIGHIKEAVEIIRYNKNTTVDIHAVAQIKTDKKVNEFLMEGNCIGCFYIESPAMRGLLKKLKCNNYLTLVAASSVIRPGVAKSGMMKAYIERHNGFKAVDYLHPVMEQQLQETFGVMVYQEDVLKVCHHYAGLDLADADVLRRAMSGKYRSKKEFERIVFKFFENSKKLGRDEAVTKEVWRQVESFAGYSFSKAHSASFAVESYQSLYLKTYFPHEFMVAVINNFGGFYRTWLYVHEARMMGCTILLPCVNNSCYKTTIKGNTIYLGFVHIAHLTHDIAKQIEIERNANGLFKDLNDFIVRMQVSAEQVNHLIRVGAFRFTQQTKQALMWQSYSMVSGKKLVQPARLFYTQHKTQLPHFTQSALRDAFDEMEMLGFPVSLSFFDMLKTTYRGDVMADDLPNCVGKTVKMLGCFVTYKPVKTVKGHTMAFGTFIDVKGKFFDTVHFPPVLLAYPFSGDGCYLILGKVVSDFNFCSVEVIKMARLPFANDPRRAV
jgi:DNA polymerase-3 subunit alpha